MKLQCSIWRRQSLTQRQCIMKALWMHLDSCFLFGDFTENVLFHPAGHRNLVFLFVFQVKPPFVEQTIKLRRLNGANPKTQTAAGCWMRKGWTSLWQLWNVLPVFAQKWLQAVFCTPASPYWTTACEIFIYVAAYLARLHHHYKENRSGQPVTTP